MKPPISFLWHDYETFGANPQTDRPAQFAAQRTDADLNPMGEPVVWYCAPADDVMPHPHGPGLFNGGLFFARRLESGGHGDGNDPIL